MHASFLVALALIASSSALATTVTTATVTTTTLALQTPSADPVKNLTIGDMSKLAGKKADEAFLKSIGMDTPVKPDSSKAEQPKRERKFVDATVQVLAVVALRGSFNAELMFNGRLVKAKTGTQLSPDVHVASIKSGSVAVSFFGVEQEIVVGSSVTERKEVTSKSKRSK